MAAIDVARRYVSFSRASRSARSAALIRLNSLRGSS